MKVDRTYTFANFAPVVNGEALLAARAAAEAAIKRAVDAGREPVQIEVTVRVAPKES